MSATTFTSDERLALLLTVLGDDVAKVAFQSMSETKAASLKKLLNEFKTDPPSNEEMEYIIGDFNQYFKFALETLGPQVAETIQGKEAAVKKKSEPDKPKATVYFSKLTPTNDPVTDLNRLDPFQIASAIGDDHPKTVAMVLRNLHVKQAAKVLEQLKPEVRSDAVIFLTRESTVPAPIVAQVLKSTVQKAITVEFREEVVDQSQVLAELMRSLPKELRVQLMEQLGADNPELMQSIKSKLYLFSDVLRLDDRDVQKLLAEVESDSLIVSLQRCEQELVDKLLNNLSKRARESIIEEMEYKTGVSEDELETARAQLIGAIARLDESGDISLQ